MVWKKAKDLFQWVFDRSQEIGWQRIANYAQNWIAINLIIEGNLEEAEQYLRTGLSIAQENREKSRIAHYQAAFGFLEVKRGNEEEAKKWEERSQKYILKEDNFRFVMGRKFVV